MTFDPQLYAYPSRRMVILGRRGMVATSQVLAAQRGLRILEVGGNAVDAAIATAACLTVVEPTSNGIGGDAFALVWTNGRLYGLNASGPAPRAISIEQVLKAGFREVPSEGWIPVTVPGVPAAWAELSHRFGVLPLDQVLEPAADYAEYGYPVSPVVSQAWHDASRRFGSGSGPFQAWYDTFAPEGRIPNIGDLWRSPDHAYTLRLIGQTRAEAFYRGELAERIDACSREQGGFLRKADLEEYAPEWVEPIRVNYRGYDVWEIPPNGQGLVALMALNILKGFEFSERDTAATYHKQIEAIKLAFTDGQAHITDIDRMQVPIEALLSEDYAAERRRLIGDDAISPRAGRPRPSGTVYLATADSNGNMVSYIQSNYKGFGSGVVIPHTGISLHNRGMEFSLDPSHINCLEPGKKTFHTIIPGFLTKDGRPIGPFGVMGAYMQAQGHVQVVMNTVDFGLNPQTSLDAPRWFWNGGKVVSFESSSQTHIVQQLAKRGHIVCLAVDVEVFGRGQMIWRNEDGLLVGGTDPRADGTVAVW